MDTPQRHTDKSYSYLDFFVGSLSSSELFVRGDFLQQKLSFLKNREKNKNIILARSAYSLDYLIIDLFLYFLFYELSLLKRAPLKVVYNTYFGGKNENIYLFAQVLFLSNALSLPPVGLRLITLQNRINLLQKIDSKQNKKDRWITSLDEINDEQKEILLSLPLALAKKIATGLVFTTVALFFLILGVEQQAIRSHLNTGALDYIVRGEEENSVLFEVQKSAPNTILTTTKTGANINTSTIPSSRDIAQYGSTQKEEGQEFMESMVVIGNAHIQEIVAFFVAGIGFLIAGLFEGIKTHCLQFVAFVYKCIKKIVWDLPMRLFFFVGNCVIKKSYKRQLSQMSPSKINRVLVAFYKYALSARFARFLNLQVSALTLQSDEYIAKRNIEHDERNTLTREAKMSLRDIK